ncbi:acyl transferase domain-containing protein/acyl carrier protein [Actinoalloteichus hymeniacidonis]|uniref:6-deoxyerythronolide-B synthase n=1 Tax=Actinoalloteichus hymeniacidonis TaxID=340345 RepID=A0AAC9HQI6_9PSEU|nr:type I polyketide synthase [Actinoalloteichus hymeniacidonis]AOS63727.1 polyketide synthase family protein [Actinoalloteichus hymeniacidonis]MBB5908219.1 acyl transferase domain-containing protein/acyl carrier protein [Actinoalloteichus hymeniacidonis]
MDSAAGSEVSVTEAISALRASLLENQRLRKQNQELLASAAEPIAVVGMAGRYPSGANDLDGLWRLLLDETDAMTEPPTNRGWELWNSSIDGVGAFLDDIAGFDAAFFGISPREAASMDPQQRVLLEAAWSALENAAIVPSSLRGSRTGVFVGGTPQEYGALLARSPELTDGYGVTGVPASVLSGRISFALGLEGPAVTVDTACSSSLVALHLAIQALRNEECDLALGAGVLLLSSPAIWDEFARQRGLAGDGRCKSFADSADGTGWGEGVGVLVLERLSDAQRNGHRVLALLRGSAVNSDGASNGLTAPNGPSQQRVIRAALANAGLSPSDVDMVEAHGTGTRLGDPIEAQALLATYGQDRERPLLLGSIKSNIGHLQAAAGVTSVIKAILALRHGMVPASLHIETPSSQVDWAAGSVELVTSARPLPATGRPWRAGVSSFGISGTNAHVVVEQAPAVEQADPSPEVAGLPLLVSARSEAALDGQIARLDRWLADHPDTPAADVAWSLATTRAVLDHRAFLLDGAWQRGTVLSGAVAVLFTGQGSQHEQMGSHPLLVEEYDRVKALFDPSLFDGDLDSTGVAQPAVFALQIALWKLWQSWGLRPDRLIGHSVGELAAAVVAGVWSLEDACRVVAARARLMQALPAGGAMLAVDRPVEGVPDTVSIAAVNSPTSTVLSGPEDEIEAIAVELRAAGARVKRLKVSHAFHSALMEPMLADFASVLETVVFHPPRIPIITTSGAGGEIDTPQYWVDQVRATVRFADAIGTAVEQGVDTFLELGPDAVLTPLALETEGTVTAISAQHRDRDLLFDALGRMWQRGLDPDWTTILPRGAHVDLPTYAFHHESYWVHPTVEEESADPADAELWRAIESGDVAALAAELDLPDHSLDTVVPALTAWRARRRQRAESDAWRYRLVWRPVATTDGTEPTGRWLIVVPEDVDASPVVAALTGAEVDILVATGDWADRLATHPDVDAVLSLLAFDERPHPTYPEITNGLVDTLELIKTMAARLPATARWIMTRGCHDRPAQAAVWGLGHVAGLEHSAPGGLIDCADTAFLPHLPAALSSGEDQARLTETGVLGRRMIHAPLAEAGPARPWTPHGTVLITGGTGGIGAHLARWAVANGAEGLVLTSRRGLAARGAEDLRDELNAAGVAVTIATCDVADRNAVAEVLADIPAERPLTAVLHAAGVARHTELSALDVDELADVLRGKTLGARWLDELTADLPLDAFVLFSSGAAAWGGATQGAYAAANSYLDTLATARRNRGLPATSIAWGAWQSDGMAEGAARELIQRLGLRLMEPGPAIAALRAAVEHGDGTLAVADIDWSLFAPGYLLSRRRPLIMDIPEVADALAEVHTDIDTDSGLRAELAGFAPADRHRRLIEVVRSAAATVLRHGSAEAIDVRRPFHELGFDSLTAVEMRNQVAAATGIRLPATLVFDHPSVQELAAHLDEQLGGAAAQPVAVAPTARTTDDPIVIVGMACRYPGQVRSPEDLWKLVCDGVDAIGYAPEDRGWSSDGRDFTGSGGFLAEAGDFDAAFFDISPREAVSMDPQQRLLLETAWEAVERAGIDPASLRGSRTGVFVGGAVQEYATLLVNSAEGAGGYTMTSSSGSVLSGRISYALGLEGPAVTVDTACSSSLVTLHLAAQALRAGECDLALAGGVTVMTTPGIFQEFGRQGGLSSDGRCRSFADTADGTGWGEGVGLLAVQRLSDARRDGHRVLAVVAGSAINQDGASNGLTAPNGPSQQRVIRAALADAGLTAAEVDVVEAHGTGTRLGDPIEAQAVLATYGTHRDRPLLLGSIKSNIGHTQAAAGVAGIIKMVLAIRHGQVPATLHVDEPSRQVDWTTGQVALLTSGQDWPAVDRPRRAGVSSFGISGTNAHVIIEQPPAAEPVPEPAPASAPLVVSARTETALHAQTEGLTRWLAANPDTSPRGVAWSLATARAALDHRAFLLDGGWQHGEVRPGSVAVLFTGQGSQHEQMGSHPLLVEEYDRVKALFDPSLFDGDLDSTGVAQPAVFALQIALWKLWQSWGLRPDRLIGHSVGELAAAVVAGVWSLEDACRVVAARARLMQALPAGGAMLAVDRPVDEVPDTLSVAAVNSPTSTVLSGPEVEIEAIAVELRAAGARVKRLKVSHAFHSALMEPMLAEFAAALRDIEFNAPRIPIITTSGAGGEITSPQYWVDQVRATVRFADAVRTAVADGVDTFLELGPDAALAPMTLETAPDAVAIPALRKGHDQLDTALGRMWLAGFDPDWTAILPRGTHVDLPTYPFQHERYWVTPAPGAASDNGPDAELWQTIESGDVAALAAELDLPDHSLDTVVPALAAWRARRQERAVTDGWRYRISWKPVALPRSPRLTGRWLIVVPEGVDHSAVAQALIEAEVRTLVATGDWTEHLDADVVLSLLALDERPHPDHPELTRGLVDTLLLEQAMRRTESPATRWLFTRGADLDPRQAAIHGLGQVASLEHPQGWGGLIDCADDTGLRYLTAALASGEDQLRLTADGVLSRRLRRAQPEHAESWMPRGTVLITGGTGGLGAHLARWAASHGADRLVLTSRQGIATPGAEALRAELGATGVAVTVAACDVADRSALAELLATDPPDAILHAAGVAPYEDLSGIGPAELAAAMRGKAIGARWLDELTAELPLDAFVLFSSGAAAWGGATQGAYAAANAYLDALAVARHARGLPATSIAWGGWDGPGMSAAADHAALARRGLRLMDPALALTVLARTVAAGDSQLVVTDMDWSKFAPGYAMARRRPLIEDIAEAAEALAETSDGVAGAGDELRDRLAPLGAADRRDRLTELIRIEAAEVLGHQDATGVPAGRPFQELGFDSLTAVELRNRIARVTGLRPSATMVFDHPNPTALADFLLAELFGADPIESASAVAAPVTDDPIVIVGMACRYPGGVRSPDDLWRLVAAERDAIGPVPTDRGWQTGADTEGGFLHDVASFDAAFFGISPREALAMDPQQRLLLETAYEALESVGTDPATLRGSRTGVFVGGTVQEYAPLLVNSPEGNSGYTATGASSSVMSGRINYVFGFEGPAVTVDTACSSSLVSMHLAAQALRAGECDRALAGGVAVMATPGAFAEFGKQGAIAGDGRCKAFSDGADGTGWAEGVGLLVLERRSEAERHGHPILAVVCGSATNSDGASNGLTAPNGPSQQRVIRAALRSAGLAPSEVDAVEAHGTGTTLGDPIEAQAVLATYGQDRVEPLYLGSIKSNIGHSQHAAGIAGVIKMVQAMRHGILPATLYAAEPTSQVDWSAGAVSLLAQSRPWPEADRPRRAAVSGFGMSGTNAHVILEQPATVPATDDAVPGGPLPFVLGAHSGEALTEMAATLAATPWTPADLAATLATSGRSGLSHRAVLTAQSAEELTAGLRSLAQGEPRPELVRGVSTEQGRVTFVFPGQGAQWQGMGRELWATAPVFAESMQRCAQALEPYVDWTLREMVDGGPGEAVDVVQPVSWAVMVSLAALWRAAGVEPDAVVGHSQGEIAAAVVAGALTLDEGARIVALRSRLIGATLSGHGGMVSVALDEASVAERIARWDGRISLAAVNSPESSVVAGEPEALREFLDGCVEEGIRARRIAVDYASHTAQVDALDADITEALAGLAPVTAPITLCSSVTGDILDTAELDGAYWSRNLRSTVRFGDAVETLTDAGHTVFIEVSSHPVLAMAVDATASAREVPITATGSLRRDDGGIDRFTLALAEAWVAGVAVDWPAVLPARRRVALPPYPFQRRRFWLDSTLTAARNADPVDERFWTLVESHSLAAELDMPADTPLSEFLPALAGWRERGRRNTAADAWRYRLRWKALPHTGPGLLAGTWLVVGTAAGPDITQAIEAAGARALNEPTDEAGSISGIIVAPTDARDTVALTQTLDAIDPTAPRWYLTRDAADRPDQAQIRSIAQIAGLEQPRTYGGIVDIGPGGAHRLAAALTAGQDEVRVTEAGLFARRLTRAPLGGAPASRSWRPSGTVLITGGTGGIGASLARWAADRGAEHILLVGRRGDQAPGAAELREELVALGVHATVAACDLADRDAVAALLAGIPAEYPLTAILHAAGIGGGYAELSDLDPADLAATAAGKADGARHLDELTADHDLDAFVLFSSGAAVWGSAGQAAYASANGYLDGLAAARRSQGRTATCIAWGAWGSGGMLDADRAAGERLARLGVRLMDPAPAIAAMVQAVEHDETSLTVADLDWERFAPGYTMSRRRTLIDDIPEATEALDDDAAPTEASGVGADLRELLAGLTDFEQRTTLIEVLRGEIAAVLGHDDPAEIREDRPFTDLGFDSLTAMELRNRLTARTGNRMRATLVFDFPTTEALADHVLSTMDLQQTAPRRELADATEIGHELDRIERALPALGAGPESDALRDRLRRLIAVLGTDTTDLDDATDDELFDLIDRDLGVS